MIILNRDEAQQVLDVLNAWRTSHIAQPLADISAPLIETLRAKLQEYPRHKVTPHDFVATATGKENLIGIPIIWAEWPMREER